MFDCPCCTFSHNDFLIFKKHVRRHRLDQNLSVFKCIACEKTFKNYWSWERHLRGTHNIPESTESTVEFAGHDQDIDLFTADGEPDLPQAEEASGPAQQYLPRLKVAKLLGFLRDNHVSDSVCSAVAQKAESIVINALEEYAEQNAAPAANEKPCHDHLPTVQALKDFQSSYRYNKFVEDELPYVSPDTVILGKNDKGVKQSFQYVPLETQLKKIVSLPQVRQHIVTEKLVQGDVIDDVFDGTAHLGRERNVLYISISYDDFEIANPLGSAAGVHKVAALHFSILNVPVELRSRVDTIFLLILCLTSYVRKYGWERILKRLIEDLQRLYASGFEVLVDGVATVIRVKLLFLCGDNLAVHGIGGFLENFSTGKSPCRFCLSSPDQWQDQFSEADCRLRDAATYDSQIEALETSHFSPSLVSETGIRTVCAFSQLPEFNVADSFPPDVAHDLLEGVLPYVLSLVLTSIVVGKKYISLEKLNDLIRNFTWGIAENAPRPIRIVKNRIKVRQTASETWTLFRFLPLIIGRYVPVACKEWWLLTEFCDILGCIFARKFSAGGLVYLEEKISSWLLSLKSVFPDFRLKPKFHFMLHYCSQIRKHGPLRYCWTLRFESKYAFLKGLVKSNKNFRNITKTIAHKHQQHIAFAIGDPGYMKMEMSEFVFSSPDECGGPKSLKQVLANSGATFGKKAVLRNTEYTSGSVLLVSNERFEFGEVEAVCIQDNHLCFLVVFLNSVFDLHVNAYEVWRSEMWSVVKIGDLRDFKPLRYVKMDMRTYVVQQYNA